MTDRADAGQAEVSIVARGGRNAVEAYETEHTTVLYEAANPLAWIEAGETVRIDDAA